MSNFLHLEKVLLGDNEEHCATCEGWAYIACGTCDGYGYLVSHVDDSEYTGKVRCPQCMECDVAGAYACFSCKGTGIENDDV